MTILKMKRVNICLESIPKFAAPEQDIKPKHPELCRVGGIHDYRVVGNSSCNLKQKILGCRAYRVALEAPCLQRIACGTAFAAYRSWRSGCNEPLAAQQLQRTARGAAGAALAAQRLRRSDCGAAIAAQCLRRSDCGAMLAAQRLRRSACDAAIAAQCLRRSDCGAARVTRRLQ